MHVHVLYTWEFLTLLQNKVKNKYLTLKKFLIEK